MVGRRRSPTHRFRLVVVSLASVLVALGAGPQSLAEEPEIVYPEVAGTTVIHGDGIVGITLMLPEPVRIFTDNLTVSAAEGTTYLWTGFRSHVEPSAFCDFCLRNTTRLIPEFSPEIRKGGCFDIEGNDLGCPYEARQVELYLVTDGPATLTLTLPQLEGVIELTATAEVEGVLEELSVTGCAPLTDCSQGFSYGGKSRAIGLDGPANADVVGFVVDRDGINGVINPGIRHLDVCAYPGNFAPDASGDPADHPTGCDGDNIPGVYTGGDFVLFNDGGSETHGLQYLGFKLWNRRVIADALFRVWGRWLEAGMTCGSRDFHDCTKPPPGQG